MTAKIPAQPERRMLNKTLAAAYLGISVRTLVTLKMAGELPSTPIGNRTLFDKQDLDAYVDRVKRSAR